MRFPTSLLRLSNCCEYNFALSVVNVVSSFKIGYNVPGLCVRAGFGAQICQQALQLIRSTKLQVCTSPRLTQNPCYQLCFYLSILLSFVNNPKISECNPPSFVPMFHSINM